MREEGLVALLLLVVREREQDEVALLLLAVRERRGFSGLTFVSC